MNTGNRLEMFLALNAEAFKKGLSDAGAGLRVMAGGAGTAFAEAKNRLQENVSELKNYNSEASKGSGVVQALSGHLIGLAGALGATFSIMAGANKLVDVTREFDKLSAGLVTATGSAEGSKQAFTAIQDFATKTPYDLAQVTDAFIKLTNFGLNPSERAMTSYGNTSSALGKDLGQMIEAVADAATGEFERLKEFGIKAKSEGDKVSFTFRGITQTVGKNAAEIETYLIKLGETNFGDAMVNRMNTLDGAMSNLGDEWNKLFLNISQSGIGEAIADGVRVGISALENLNGLVASGQLLAYLQASIGQWSAWGEEVNNSISTVGKLFDGEMGQIETRGATTTTFLTDAFRQFPENVRAFIGLITVGVAAEFDKIKADAKAFKDGIKAIFTSATLEEVDAARDQQHKIIDEARDATIDSILKERDTTIKANDDKIEAAKKLRTEYEKTRAAAKDDKADRLKKFKVQDQDKDIDAQEEKKAYQKKQKNLAKTKENATPEYFKERKDYWRDLEKERPLTKEELKERKDEGKLESEMAKEAKRKAAEKNEVEKKATDAAAAAAKRTAEVQNRSRRSRLLRSENDEMEAMDREASPELTERQPDDHDNTVVSKVTPSKPPEADKKKPTASEELIAKRAAETAASLDEIQAEAAKKKTERQEAQDLQNKNDLEEINKRNAEVAEQAKKHEAEIAKANADRIEAAKKGAEEVAQAEIKASEQAKSALQKYADKVRTLQDDIAGRQKSLAEDVDSLDTRGTAESKWRKKAREAKEYEKAAKAAMKAGDLGQALSLADQAKESYKALKGGAGTISDRQGDQIALRGVKASGLLGIDIVKALQQVTAKTALTAMPGSSLLGDLSGRIRGQLAAVAGGNSDNQPGKGSGQQVTKVHELKFKGGSLRGGEADVEALLNLLAQAGMSAG